MTSVFPGMSRGVMVSFWPVSSTMGLWSDQLAGTDLRSLQVGQNTDGLTLLIGNLAHHLDQLELLGLRAVRKV